MLLWFYCLIMCKWAQNTKFWNFHENQIEHCIFVKINIFDQNSAEGRFLRFVASFVSYAIFMFTAVKIITSATYSRNLSFLITSSLSVALIWMFKQCTYSNAWGSTNFSYVQFNGGIQMNVLMSIVDKLLMIKCSNFLRGSSYGLSSHLYTLK